MSNSLVLAIAWNDKSRGAFWIAVVGGPILNACLALGAAITTLLLKVRYPQFSWMRHLLLSLSLPAAAIFVDGWIITSMDLHGSL
ncbi:MAG TPA: hypothetical protein VGS22_18230 [Thermoanaerobaculia bacterium]|nr:hypothetical protein [Thermoanaerobaculia bacterium]